MKYRIRTGIPYLEQTRCAAAAIMALETTSTGTQSTHARDPIGIRVIAPDPH